MLFEREVENGTYLDGEKITFAEFTDKWLVDYAEKQLAPKTLERYRVLLRRINTALGHIRLSKLQPTHILEFYNNLRESGIRDDYKYSLNESYIGKVKNNKNELIQQKIINYKSLKGLLMGNTTLTAVACRISDYFSLPLNKLFVPVDVEKGLSSQTILHHHRLLSTLLETAMRWQLINSNPANRVESPKVEHKEAAYFNDEQVKQMLKMLELELLKYQVAIYIAVLGGLRLGEIVGLSWDDVNMETGRLTISKSSQYTKSLGNFKKSPKNTSSKRTLMLPQAVITKLKALKREQSIERFKLGDLWVETNNILTQNNGGVMFPTTPTNWFKKWLKKTGLPKVTFHQLRHTNASILIAQGIDVITVSKRLGHSRPSTTTDIYSHIINRVDESAAVILDDIFGNVSSS